MEHRFFFLVVEVFAVHAVVLGVVAAVAASLRFTHTAAQAKSRAILRVLVYTRCRTTRDELVLDSAREKILQQERRRERECESEEKTTFGGCRLQGPRRERQA